MKHKIFTPEKVREVLRRMRESDVCTHYQDNCSCLSAKDTKIWNRCIDSVIKVIEEPANFQN